jgi:hypothetical protein
MDKEDPKNRDNIRKTAIAWYEDLLTDAQEVASLRRESSNQLFETL